MSATLRDRYETGREINADPLIWLFENYIQDDEIAALLDAATPRLEDALVSSPTSGVKSEGRSGRNSWIAHDFSPVIAALCERVSALVDLPLENAESLQVVHYELDQRYAPHFDAWDADTETGARCMARGGQRLVTCLMYLNDVEMGGGTEFPKLKLEVSARRGTMVVFHNCHHGTALRHPDSLHGGMPVKRGHKWACNLWFREASYHKVANNA